jgi:hypothetical protein
MKWAHVPSNHDPRALLIWALTFAIEDPYHSFVENISNLFLVEGEIGGDPGWEIHRHVNNDGSEWFDVCVDSRVSGLEKNNQPYDAPVVRRTTCEILHAFSEAYPSKNEEVKQLITTCKLRE